MHDDEDATFDGDLCLTKVPSKLSRVHFKYYKDPILLQFKNFLLCTRDVLLLGSTRTPAGESPKKCREPINISHFSEL